MPDLRLGAIGTATHGLAYSTLRWQAMIQKGGQQGPAEPTNMVKDKVPIDKSRGSKIDMLV